MQLNVILIIHYRKYTRIPIEIELKQCEFGMQTLLLKVDSLQKKTFIHILLQQYNIHALQ